MILPRHDFTTPSSPKHASVRLILLAAAMLRVVSVAADPASLEGKIMCGYQGWFAAEDDGMGVGWRHYGFHAERDVCQIEMWPDVTGFGVDELFASPLKLADGTAAQVFSSAHPRTVLRHFEWMREHGIDGVFLQRFGASLGNEKSRAFCDRVLANVRAAAKATGRTWSLMYDLSGLRAEQIEALVMQDWKRMRNELRIIDDPTYQRHGGRPVVAVWGIGFNDGRKYALEDTARLLRFMRDNPEFGGMTVMAGVPFGWRTLDRDAVADAALHEVLESAAIISPWAVGRYNSPDNAAREIARVHDADAAWCKERGKEYLPVVFPGFSWRNLMKSRGQDAKLNAIPRRDGEFLWRQAMERARHGSRMLYVAMFDEMDEGTAIFKCTSTVPQGTEGFVTYGEKPSDHYLWLTGEIGRVLRGEKGVSDVMPAR